MSKKETHTPSCARQAAMAPVLAVSVLLLAIMLLASCVKQPIGPGADINIGAAQAAYSAGDLQQAEAIASALTRSALAGPSEQSAAWRIIALTSQAGGRPQTTLQALEQWRGLEPQAAAGDEWLQLWRSAIDELPYPAAAQAATAAAAAPNAPRQLIIEAKLYLLESRLRAGSVSSATSVSPADSLHGLAEEFEQLYQSAGDLTARQRLEQRLFRQLHGCGQATLHTLSGLVNEINEKYYPYALFRLEEARRLFLDETTQELAREMVAFMSEDSRLADRSLLRTWAEPDLSYLESFVDGNRIGAINLALVLPLSGQYGNLSDKIAHGAEIAGNGFRRNGLDVRLYVIDSDQPNWLHDLAALPAEVQIVGGPLRASDYAAIKAMEQTGQRKFFTFLRGLEPGEEGNTAWRFFSSSEDQIEAVLLFAKNLGITTYAAITPTDDYGQRMSALFQSEVAALNNPNGFGGAGSAYDAGSAAGTANVFVKEQLYPAGEHQAWNKLVAEFLATNKEAEEPPLTPFKALFLPDSWQNATIMMPHFFYYRENRLLFMGTMLWEQGISLQQRADSSSYQLAVFPGAWDPNTLAPAGMILRSAMAAAGQDAPDFWVSLGYDFVTMAASLPAAAHSPKGSADDLNLALASLSALPWSGAPLSWNNEGEAKQTLFVFTPSARGFILADPVKFRLYYKRAWEKKLQ